MLKAGAARHRLRRQAALTPSAPGLSAVHALGGSSTGRSVWSDSHPISFWRRAMRVLRMPMSLRMQAVSATFGFFPLLIRRSMKALITGYAGSRPQGRPCRRDRGPWASALLMWRSPPPLAAIVIVRSDPQQGSGGILLLTSPAPASPRSVAGGRDLAKPRHALDDLGRVRARCGVALIMAAISASSL